MAKKSVKPQIEPAPPIDNDHVAPGATPFTEEEIALNAAPASDVQAAYGPALNQFRKLWNGGEHRRAIDAGNAAGLSPEEWAVLHGEFPEILDVING